MIAAEFVDARQRLGIASPILAVELNLTPDIVAAFEDGSLAIPKDVEAEMRWRVAARERLDALAASELPECDWVLEWERKPWPSKAKALEGHLDAFNAHVAGCPTCKARQQFVDERFGPMPERPIPGWRGTAVSILKWIERLPRPLQPAAKGALLFLAYSLFRLIFLLPRLAQTPRGWLVALGGIVASMTVGAVIGSIFGGVRWLWERMRRPNPPAARI